MLISPPAAAGAESTFGDRTATYLVVFVGHSLSSLFESIHLCVPFSAESLCVANSHPPARFAHSCDIAVQGACWAEEVGVSSCFLSP